MTPRPRPPTISGPYQCPFDGSLLIIATASGLYCPACHAAGDDQSHRHRPPPPPAHSMDINIDVGERWPPTWVFVCAALAVAIVMLVVLLAGAAH